MATKYDWKKTGVKALIVAGEIVVAGAIVYITDKPELIFLAPIFEAFLDWIKHR